MTPRAGSAGARALRPEVQALRAAAVLLVVIYHLWPSALPGGFAGVDVFFAISGFLITSLLLREVDRSEWISLVGFWARRARRILPAALTTLLFCAVATVVVVPENYWQQFFTEVRASTAYVQNWHLATAAVDYFAAEEGPSPVQHFWTLSAEEQFYLVWPVLILLAVGLTRRQPAHVRRRWIAIVMAALTAASLVYSVQHTAANPAAAYFVTLTRAWEFGAGGLLALVGQRGSAHTRVRSALSWAGIAAIALTAAAYTDATAFPGYAALLPVLGALAVMWAGTPSRRWAPTRLLKLRPVQFLGDVSYSVYLWHWPLIVLAPFAIERGLHTDTRIAILMLTILIAWLSKRLIEDPVRTGAFLLRRTARWTFACVAVGTGVVIAISATGTSHVQAEIRKAELVSQRILAEAPRCFGAAARDPERPCANPKLRLAVVPTPLEARDRPNAPCTTVELRNGLRVCAFGAAPARATATVALVGDSHASHWRAALEVVARSRRWQGLSITHSSCPFSRGVRALLEPARSSCIRWKRELLAWFRRHPEVRTVFVSQLSGGSGIESSGRDQFAAQVDGYRDAWKSLPKSVERIVVIRDTPKVRGDTDACVQRAIAKRRRAGVACAVPRGAAVQRDAAAVAAERLRSGRVRIADLTRMICDRRRCYPVIGGALVFKDATHLTAVFATTLGPYLQREVDRALPAAG